MIKHDEKYNICKFRAECKSQDCSFKCYPFTAMHGLEGKSGIWSTRNIPKKYENCSLENLIDITPSETKEKMKEYMLRVLEMVAKGAGLFLYSIPQKDNVKGTGTGKTTVASTIINQFVKERVKQSLTEKDKLISQIPAFFIEMADFQNIYNAQFRGFKDSQEEASERFYSMKEKMKTVELLVLDDIAIRNTTEAFNNELYEIINHRVTEELSTIYTSNETLEMLTDALGERIASRIEGSCFIFPFAGRDHRKKEW